VVARITGEFERLDIAQAAAETVLAVPSAIPFLSRNARTSLALLAVLRGDVAVAQESYTALESGRGMLLAPIFSMSADRLLGLLAQTMGKPDQAAAHFEDALAFCRKAGCHPELAWSCCDYADLLLNPVGAVREPLLQPTNPDLERRARAMALLDEALKISSELGMRPLMERVLSQRDILKA
jgi:tetratricopeptide (TPR) repeat protein